MSVYGRDVVGISLTSSAAGIAAANLSTKVHMARRIHQMQQVVVPIVVVNHGARLGLDRDAAFSLDIEFVQNLLVAASLYGTRDLQQSVTERALAVVNVRDNAKVAEPLNGDPGDPFLQRGCRGRWRWLCG